MAGLGLLPVDTVLGGDKQLREVSGECAGVPFTGYEMHVGRTTGIAAPLLTIVGRPEGAVSADGLVAGCYVHGLFTDDAQRAAWLRRLGANPTPRAHDAEVEAVLEQLAIHVEQHIDVDGLLALAR